MLAAGMTVTLPALALLLPAKEYAAVLMPANGRKLPAPALASGVKLSVAFASENAPPLSVFVSTFPTEAATGIVALKSTSFTADLRMA